MKFITNKYFVLAGAVIACSIWGSVLVVIKFGYIALNIAPDEFWMQVMFASYRFLLAGFIIIFLYSVFGRKIIINKAFVYHTIVLAVTATTVKYMFMYYGLGHTTGVKASITASTLVIWNIVLAAVFIRGDRITFSKIIGVFLGFSGVIITNLKDLGNPGSVEDSLLGVFLIFLTQMMSSISHIYIKKIKGDVQIIPLTGAHMIAGALILMLPASLKVGLFPFTFNTMGAVSLIYLAFAGAIAFSLWNTIMRHNILGNISVYFFIIPVSGTILSTLILKESLSVYAVIGLLLVSLSIFVVNFRDKKQDEVYSKDEEFIA
ncbi:MAG: DMT family transporter [Elusimicrobiota bacterium]